MQGLITYNNPKTVYKIVSSQFHFLGQQLELTSSLYPINWIMVIIIPPHGFLVYDQLYPK